MQTKAYTTKFQAAAKVLPDEKLSASLLVSPVAFTYALSTNHFRNVVEISHQVAQDQTTPNQHLSASVIYLMQNALLHQKKLERIHLAVLSGDFTMVPEAFALERDIKPVLEFSTGQLSAKRAQRHHLQQLDFFYGVDTELATSVERLFPNISIRHAGAVTINLLFSHHSLAQATVFLNVADGYIELAAKQKKDLLFYNVFSYQSNEDILYYLLFMMEQFQLNPLHTHLCLAGERPVQDELFKNIKKYIKQVSFCVPDKSVQVAEELSSLPAHYYFSLLNQHLCEL